MKDPARIQAIIEILGLVLREEKPADGIISAAFRARRYIGSKDRNAVAGSIYDILRHFYRLSWWLSYLNGKTTEKENMPNEARSLTLIYLSLIKKFPAKGLNTHFSGEKFAPPPLTAYEKKLLQDLEGRTLFHPAMPEGNRLECPPAYLEKLREIFGADLEKELQAMQAEATLDVRVNTLKASRADVLAALQKENIEAAETPFSPWGLRVKGRPPLAQLSLFKDGAVEIQDEGSQLIALLLAPKPGMAVVDFCAGAGGKTLALAALMENKGRIVACDVLGGRLKRGRERFRRAGAHNIEVRELKHERDDWVKRNAGKYDRVLVDAPCSGTGTWRRNPDARWKELGPKIDALVALQSSILISAARLVKPGGMLVYATCSLLPDENQKQVDAFLSAHADFGVQPALQLVSTHVGGSGAYLQLTPAKHGTDGFFAALLQRKATESAA